MKTIIKTKLFLTKLLVILFVLSATQISAQICAKYTILPDTVSLNILTDYQVQEVTGGISPPALWVCHWIDFEGNGTQDCISNITCSYTFGAGGLHLVTYQIEEPFLGNIEVCSSYVFVDACNTGTVTALADGNPDSLSVCTNTAFQLSLNTDNAVSCPDVWEFAWHNGSQYYNGSNFSSPTPVWNSNYQSINISGITAPTIFTGKVKCSSLPHCTDTSNIKLILKPDVGAVTLLGITERCQGAETIQYIANAANADSIKFSINAASIMAGNSIDANTGILSFAPLFHGTTFLHINAYGCNGPSTESIPILTRPLPSFSLLADTSTLCIGDSIFLTATLNGSLQGGQMFFELTYGIDSGLPLSITSTTNTLELAYLVVDTAMVFNFYEISDWFCTNPIGVNHYVLASPPPVFNLHADTFLCQNENILLEVTPGYDAYQWSHGSSTSNQLMVDTSLAGIDLGFNTIFVSITNAYCTQSDSVVIQYVVCMHTGKPIEENLDILIFPNPSSGFINIQFNQNNDKPVNVEIFDLQGRRVHQALNINLKDNLYTVHIDKPGVYLLYIYTDGFDAYIRKFTIK